VKELEKVINEYLSELSHFQIYFKLSGDKLNIEVLDDAGNITGVESLSTGERGRVNIATVLAIRKIMSSLTSTRINFLFLDEIVGTIDDEGKNAICDILLNENLNTFIVSHDWTHPLLSKVHITKEGKTSRIEH
jgi:DNA repair exonuclease SbcCD ATPase subunit